MEVSDQFHSPEALIDDWVGLRVGIHVTEKRTDFTLAVFMSAFSHCTALHIPTHDTY
jgi:hypothetical protein